MTYALPSEGRGVDIGDVSTTAYFIEPQYYLLYMLDTVLASCLKMAKIYLFINYLATLSVAQNVWR
jgi:hypothetical protein